VVVKEHLRLVQQRVGASEHAVHVIRRVLHEIVFRVADVGEIAVGIVGELGRAIQRAGICNRVVSQNVPNVAREIVGQTGWQFCGTVQNAPAYRVVVATVEWEQTPGQ
jgi:hypothetical protein